MTQSRLRGLIAHLPEGITEIYTHPATSSDFAGAAPGYRYEEELAALTSPDLRRQIAAAGVVSGGFADAVSLAVSEHARRRRWPFLWRYSLKDSKAADRHFRVHFERFQRLAAPFPSLCALTAELMVPRRARSLSPSEKQYHVPHRAGKKLSIFFANAGYRITLGSTGRGS